MEWFYLIPVSAVAAFALTSLLRSYALRTKLLDYPNSRSSHSSPTPRGGGVAFAAVACVGWAALMVLGAMSPELLAALLVGGIAVAAIGYIDDRFSVSPLLRLIVQAASAIWALYVIGAPHQPAAWSGVMVPGWLIKPVTVIGIVWAINLFNFMDGIDGIASSEALFVAAAGAWLSVGGISQSAPVLVLAGSVSGFLLWNWPPARIFMGDVGSGFLGYAIAVFVLAEMHHDSASFWIWLILGGVFFVDATVTLVRRAVGRQRLSEAHRTHAYQWLSRRWGSHRRVTLSLLAVNTFWLLPLAWIATRNPPFAPLIAAIALVPLVLLALMAGAGRSEVSSEAQE